MTLTLTLHWTLNLPELWHRRYILGNICLVCIEVNTSKPWTEAIADEVRDLFSRGALLYIDAMDPVCQADLKLARVRYTCLRSSARLAGIMSRRRSCTMQTATTIWMRAKR